MNPVIIDLDINGVSVYLDMHIKHIISIVCNFFCIISNIIHVRHDVMIVICHIFSIVCNIGGISSKINRIVYNCIHIFVNSICVGYDTHCIA